jgi:hypothetical protein
MCHLVACVINFGTKTQVWSPVPNSVKISELVGTHIETAWRCQEAASLQEWAIVQGLNAETLSST